MKTRNLGFTLIELVIVIGLIGILIAFSISAFKKTTISARDGRRKADLELIRTALSKYRNANSHYPSNLTVLPTTYIDKLPTDPVSGQNYTYVSGGGMTYDLCAILEEGNGTCNYHVNNP